MILDLSPETDRRLSAWSQATRQPPHELISEALEQSLEDWEDYADALRICREIDSGAMKVYTLAEVERHIEERNALEG